MLEYDHIGFQTPADRRNFVQCVKWLIPESSRTTRKRQSIIRFGRREVMLGYYPISIDFDEFNGGAHSKDVDEATWYLKENHLGRKMVLGLDRLDYTKGIPERFLAFERMFEKYPDTRGNRPFPAGERGGLRRGPGRAQSHHHRDVEQRERR